VELHYITLEDINRHRKRPLPHPYLAPDEPFNWTHLYAEMARQYMVDKYGEKSAYNDGFTVYTTITAPCKMPPPKLSEMLCINTIRGTDTGFLQTANYSPNLADHIPIGDTLPAQVKAYSNAGLTVLTQNHGTITISWKNMKWAIRSKSPAAIGKTFNITTLFGCASCRRITGHCVRCHG